MSELDKAIEKMKELKEAYEYTIGMGISRTRENDEYCKAIDTIVSTIEQLRDKVKFDIELDEAKDSINNLIYRVLFDEAEVVELQDAAVVLLNEYNSLLEI